MAAMKLTQIYLEPHQKKALQARASARGSKVAEEVRRAVDAYLAGISFDDLQLLEEGTRKAERHLMEMVDELDRINARLDAASTQLSHEAPRSARDRAIRAHGGRREREAASMSKSHKRRKTKATERS